jgi:hypothetical protein
MLVNLRALFARLIDIVLLRAGPQDLPASNALLAFVVAVNVAEMVVVTSLIPATPPGMLVGHLVDCIVALLWFQVAFAITKKRERFVQTMSAVFGVFALFLPALIPLAITVLPYTVTPNPALPPPAIPTLLGAALVVWLLIVLVRIVRAAFEWPHVAAFIFLLGLRIAATLMYLTLFGVPPQPV